MDLFELAFRTTVAHEGGVSSDPHDRAAFGDGKPHTKYGVTLKTVRELDSRADSKLREYLKARFDVDLDGDIDSDDVTGWTLESARDFYRDFYWVPCGAAKIAATTSARAIALLLFDAAVNMGVQAAVKTLQRALRVEVDGVPGPETLAAVRARALNDDFLGALLAQRLEANRKAPTADVHFLGWARRCFRLHLEALKENA
jgi:lysozyme family protein